MGAMTLHTHSHTHLRYSAARVAGSFRLSCSVPVSISRLILLAPAGHLGFSGLAHYHPPTRWAASSPHCASAPHHSKQQQNVKYAVGQTVSTWSALLFAGRSAIGLLFNKCYLLPCSRRLHHSDWLGFPQEKKRLCVEERESETSFPLWPPSAARWRARGRCRHCSKTSSTLIFFIV